MKPQRNSTRRTIISFCFAMATALMTLYIQERDTANVVSQQADKVEVGAASVGNYLVSTID